MVDSIKITALQDIGANIMYTTLVPVVDMSGTPTTKKSTLQNLGNLILNGAGGSYFPRAAQATLALSVANAAQPNITSVGTLTSLNVSGNIVVANADLGNSATANFFIGDGRFLSNVPIDGVGNIVSINLDGSSSNVLYGNGTFAPVTPGGSTTQIQFNNSGTLAGSANLIWDSTNQRLAAHTLDTANVISSNTSQIGITPGAHPNRQGPTWTFDSMGGLYWPATGGALWVIEPNPDGEFEFKSTSNIVISTDISNTNAHFTFDTTGVFTAPSNVNLLGTRLNVGAESANLPGLNAPTLVIATGSNTFVQSAITNINGNGSADTVAYGAGGDDTQAWSDLGFTGNAFSDPNYTITGPGDGYVFVQGYANTGGGNFVLATGDQGSTKDIVFATGGFAAENEFARIENANSVFHLTRANSGIQFHDGTILTTAAGAGATDRLVNGSQEVVLDATGTTAFPGNITLNGGTIFGGVPTEIVTNSPITDITPGDPSDTYANSTPLIVTLDATPFVYPIRGKAVIANVATPTEINGTWYFEAWYTNQIALFTDDTYTLYEYGTGWAAYTGGGDVDIVVNDPAADVKINSGGYETTFHNDGTLLLPSNFTALTSTIVSPFNSSMELYAGGNAIYRFGWDGKIAFPTALVDLHNGGLQSGQTLQFANPDQQVFITGPTPAENTNAQRIIIQGQRGVGTGEGGDIYLWGGDSDTNGGDIKIYAGDADSPEAGSGGYINIEGGKGNNDGGYVTVSAGQSLSGQGAPVRVVGGQGGTTGGTANLEGGYGSVSGGDTWVKGGYGGAGPGGNTYISGGASSNGASEGGNIIFTSGISTWYMDNTGNLVLPGNTMAINFANGTSAFGNVVSINLDGSSSNVLYGNGVFAPAAGGGTSSGIPYHPPVASDYTLDGTGTISSAMTDTPIGMSISFVANSGAGTNRAVTATKPAPSGPYSFMAQVLPVASFAGSPGGEVSGGLCLKDSTGQMLTFYHYSDGNLYLQKWSNKGTFTTGIATVATPFFLPNEIWLALTIDTSGNLITWYGNGTTWVLGPTVAITTYLAAGPYTIGFNLSTNGTANNIAGMRIPYQDENNSLTPPTAIHTGGGGSSYGNSNVATFLASFGSNTISTTGNIAAGNITTTVIKTTPVSYASLPSAASAGAGARAFITDGNVNTFASQVGGGGIYYIPVFSNGTNWYVG